MASKYIRYGEVRMATLVGSVAVQIVSRVAGHGGPLDEDDLVEMVYDRLWEIDKSAAERDTDRTRVRDAVRLARRLERA